MTASKLKAFFIHIAISFFIFALLTAIIYFLLFPGPLFSSDGGIQGVKIIAGVDLVLGPLLTLIVYKAGKKGMKSDLAVIASLQSIMLLIGCYLVYESRPIAIIFSDGKFHSMSKAAYEMHDISIKNIDVNPLQPNYYIIPEPENKELASSLKKSQLEKGPIYLEYDKYQPYKSNWQLIEPHTLKGEQLKKLALNDATLDKYWVIPLEGRYLQDYVLVDKTTGRLSKNISPPKH